MPRPSRRVRDATDGCGLDEQSPMGIAAAQDAFPKRLAHGIIGMDAAAQDAGSPRRSKSEQHGDQRDQR